MISTTTNCQWSTLCMPNPGTVIPSEGLEKHNQCCYLSRLLSQYPAPLNCTKLPSWEWCRLQLCSHRFRSHLPWSHCPLSNKPHKCHLQASLVPHRESKMQSFLKKYKSNFQQLAALDKKKFSATNYHVILQLFLYQWYFQKVHRIYYG